MEGCKVVGVKLSNGKIFCVDWVMVVVGVWCSDFVDFRG